MGRLPALRMAKAEQARTRQRRACRNHRSRCMDRTSSNWTPHHHRRTRRHRRTCSSSRSPGPPPPVLTAPEARWVRLRIRPSSVGHSQSSQCMDRTGRMQSPRHHHRTRHRRRKCSSPHILGPLPPAPAPAPVALAALAAPAWEVRSRIRPQCAHRSHRSRCMDRTGHTRSRHRRRRNRRRRRTRKWSHNQSSTWCSPLLVRVVAQGTRL